MQFVGLLLGVIAAMLPLPSPGLRSNSPQDCPEWVTAYTAWHADNKHASEARFLVMSCTDKGCNGLGDR